MSLVTVVVRADLNLYRIFGRYKETFCTVMFAHWSNIGSHTLICEAQLIDHRAITGILHRDLLHHRVLLATPSLCDIPF